MIPVPAEKKHGCRRLPAAAPGKHIQKRRVWQERFFLPSPFRPDNRNFHFSGKNLRRWAVSLYNRLFSTPRRAGPATARRVVWAGAGLDVRIFENDFESWETIIMSMSREEIRQKVIDITCDQLQVSKDQVKDESNFVEDLGADSLDIAELVMEFEDEFDLEIPDNDQRILTIKAAVDFIVEKTAGK
jgi:acyl carrier protein